MRLRRTKEGWTSSDLVKDVRGHVDLAVSGAPYVTAEDDVSAEVGVVVVHAGLRRDAPTDPVRRTAPDAPPVGDRYRPGESAPETTPALTGYRVDGPGPATPEVGPPVTGLVRVTAPGLVCLPLVYRVPRGLLKDAVDEAVDTPRHTAPIDVGRLTVVEDAKAVGVVVCLAGVRRQALTHKDMLGLSDVGVPGGRDTDPVTGGPVNGTVETDDCGNRGVRLRVSPVIVEHTYTHARAHTSTHTQQIFIYNKTYYNVYILLLNPDKKIYLTSS